MKKFIVLTCEALARSVYGIAAETPHTVSILLYKQGLHNRPKNLREVLQEQIDAIEPGECDAILLAYGMCGRSTIGLSSPHTPLVIPRAHDCITIYLGSRQRYQEEFDRHPGTYWYSVDYMERSEPGAAVALGAAGIEDSEAQYEEFVRKYGQASADMLMEEMRKWSQHYTRAVFIDTGQGDSERFATMAEEKAQREGWVYERKTGNRRLLEMMLLGDWSEEEILVVPPGHKIDQSYGDDVIRATPLAPNEG
jgi:hypothetical protein